MPYLRVYCIVNEDEVNLTEAEIADALNRKDELGKLVSCAFSFEIPPFDFKREKEKL